MIHDTPGRPPRRYCTAAHRSAARQARRAAVALGQDQQLAATLPWLREPDPELEPVLAPVQAAPSTAGRAASAGGPVAPRLEGSRNRLARRQAAAARPAEPLPGARTRGLNAPMPRRRRALAVLGAAGILAGGYAVTASESSSVPSQSAFEGESGAEWASRARVALTSVNKQLDTIAQIEAEWFALSEEQRAASPTGPVEALAERKLLLERRRATLESQLNSYESLSDARTDLLESEHQLAAVEAALASTPTSTPGHEASLAALDEQRDLRLRQRDARREELQALEGGVQDAAARPMPDDVAATIAVGEDVRRVIRGDVGRGRVPTQTPVPTQPDVVSGREQDGAPRQDVANSAPPDPRGPGDESAQLPEEKPAGGPLGEVVDTVGGVVGGDARDGDRKRADDRPSDPAGPGNRGGNGGGGPVDTVVDTVGDVADGPGDSGSRRDGRSSASDQGPVDTVVDTVGGVVDGPDGNEGRDRDREDRDRDRADRGNGDDRSNDDRPKDDGQRGGGLTEPLEPVVEPVVDALSPAAAGSGGRPDRDARADEAPVQDDLADVGSPAPALPDAPAGARDGDGARADEAAMAAALAMDVISSMPGGEWMAPLVEEAVNEAVAAERAPEAVAPEAVAPEAVAPEAVAPEAVAPEAVAPEAVAPEAVAPEAVAPEAAAPEAVAPEQAAPDGAAAETVPVDDAPAVAEVPVEEVPTGGGQEMIPTTDSQEMTPEESAALDQQLDSAATDSAATEEATAADQSDAEDLATLAEMYAELDDMDVDELNAAAAAAEEEAGSEDAQDAEGDTATDTAVEAPAEDVDSDEESSDEESSDEESSDEESSDEESSDEDDSDETHVIQPYVD